MALAFAFFFAAHVQRNLVDVGVQLQEGDGEERGARSPWNGRDKQVNHKHQGFHPHSTLVLKDLHSQQNHPSKGTLVRLVL